MNAYTLRALGPEMQPGERAADTGTRGIAESAGKQVGFVEDRACGDSKSVQRSIRGPYGESERTRGKPSKGFSASAPTSES